MTTTRHHPQTSRRGEGTLMRAARGMVRPALVVALALALTLTLAAPALAGDVVRLNGDVLVARNDVVDNVAVMNGDITVAGTVTGNAFAANGDITLLDGGRVDGDAVSLTGHVTTQGDATIGGDRVEQGLGRIDIGSPGSIDVTGAARGFFGFGWVFMTLGAAGLGLLLVLISARTLRGVGEEILHRPGRSALVGFLSIIGVPVLFIVLMISVIGIPIGLLMIPVLPFISLYGVFAIALVAGDRLLDVFGRTEAGDVWAMLAGVLLVAVVLLIPVLGWILFFIGGFVGFGAAVSRIWEYVHRRRNGRTPQPAPADVPQPPTAPPAAATVPGPAPVPYGGPDPAPPTQTTQETPVPQASPQEQAPETEPPETGPRYHI